MGARPASPETIYKRVNYYAYDAPIEEVGALDAGLWGACHSILEKLSQKRRYLLYQWFYPDKWETLADVTSKSMTTPEAVAILKWVSPNKPTPTSPWVGDPALQEEINAILKSMGELVQKELPNNGQEHLTAQASAKRLRDAFQKTYKGIPVMVCGHEADSMTYEWKAFCSLCSEGGSNSDAYITREIKPMEDKMIEELGYG